jgi:hypothetical protein
MPVLQFSASVRNNRLDQIETFIGASPMFRILSGAIPGSVSAADSGTKLVEIQLPSDWMAAAAVGAKAKAGTWQQTAACATGTAGYFRLYNTAGASPWIQGNVGGTGSGCALELDNTSITQGQQVTVNTFQLVDGNAD